MSTTTAAAAAAADNNNNNTNNTDAVPPLRGVLLLHLAEERLYDGAMGLAARLLVELAPWEIMPTVGQVCAFHGRLMRARPWWASEGQHKRPGQRPRGSQRTNPPLTPHFAARYSQKQEDHAQHDPLLRSHDGGRAPLPSHHREMSRAPPSRRRRRNRRRPEEDGARCRCQGPAVVSSNEPSPYHLAHPRALVPSLLRLPSSSSSSAHHHGTKAASAPRPQQQQQAWKAGDAPLSSVPRKKRKLFATEGATAAASSSGRGFQRGPRRLRPRGYC